MGKYSDDWCSRDGLKNRAEGMYKKERKCLKIFYALLFAASAIIYIVLGIVHASHAWNALQINEAYAQLLARDDAPQALPYDQCSVPNFILDPELDAATAV